MRSQVGLRKHHYEQRWWRWWNSSWAISNPKRWCCYSATLNMPANLENSAVTTGLEMVSCHSNPIEGQWKEYSNYHNCIYFTYRCTSRVQKRQRNQRSNCQHPSDHRKKQRNSRKTCTSASLTMLNPLTVWITTNCWKFLKRWEYQTPYLPPKKFICRSRCNS